MSYQAVLHTTSKTQVLHTGSYSDCMEVLARVGQAKGAPKRALVQLKWRPDAAQVEAASQWPMKGSWEETET